MPSLPLKAIFRGIANVDDPGGTFDAEGAVKRLSEALTFETVTESPAPTTSAVVNAEIMDFFIKDSP